MPTEEFAIPICRHIKTNGVRCQSPSLSSEPFCYFHVRLHKDHPAPLTARRMVSLLYDSDAEEAVIGGGEDPMQIARAYPRQNEFNFPALEDPHAIQLAASMLFHAVAQGQIHLRRARILRDMLRVANNSGRFATPAPANASVRELDHTADGVALAPADLVPIDPVPAAPVAINEPQPTPIQDFASNPSDIRILQNTPTATLPN